jgi:hypothetical protein
MIRRGAAESFAADEAAIPAATSTAIARTSAARPLIFELIEVSPSCVLSVRRSLDAPGPAPVPGADSRVENAARGEQDERSFHTEQIGGEVR